MNHKWFHVVLLCVCVVLASKPRIANRNDIICHGRIIFRGQTDRILKNKIRENDILGISEDGQLYLILSQVDDAMLPIVIERLEKNGLHCRVIDTRNESRVAEE